MFSASVAAFRTFLALFVVTLYTLIAAPLVLLWAGVSGDVRPIYAAGSLALRLGLAIAGIRVRVSGTEHLQPDRPAVYAANHNSNIDPPVVLVAFWRLYPRLKVIYKAELRKVPVLVWILDMIGFVPVERANREQSLPALDRATQSVSSGNSFVIFPEGTRSLTGALLPFKKGGFVMAIRAGVPVVPVAVSGGLNAMRKGSGIIWPATVTVSLAAPVPTTGLTVADRDALITKVRAAIVEQLDRD